MIRIGKNIWTCDIGVCRTIETDRFVINLVHPKHIFRIWKNKDKKWTKDAWKNILHGLIQPAISISTRQIMDQLIKQQ